MLIKYWGYECQKGTRQVDWFVTDMHILTFYAEYPIESHIELQEQVEKFKEDKNRFDWIDYNTGAKYHEKKY